MNWIRGSVSLIILTALWSFQLHGADPPKITTLKQLEKTWRHEVGLRVPARRVKGDPSKYSVLRGLILHRASAEFKRITSKPLKCFEAEREGNGDKSFDFYLREALLWFHLKKTPRASAPLSKTAARADAGAF